MNRPISESPREQHDASITTDRIVDAIRTAPHVAFSLQASEHLLPIADVFGFKDVMQGEIQVKTDNLLVRLHVQRWPSYHLNTRFAAGVDTALYTGCVFVQDIQSGEEKFGSIRTRMPDGSVAYTPDGTLDYEEILSATKEALLQHRRYKEEALRYDVSRISQEELLTAPWRYTPVFGGGYFTANIADIAFRVECKNFLWHALTARRTQAPFRNVEVITEGKEARALFKQLENTH